jgi:hypothetical protein
MFTNIPSATLRQLVKLSERKEALMAQIQEIDRQMVSLQAKFGVPTLSAGRRAPVTVSEGSPAKKRGRRVKRGTRPR